jgi:hypothetical protein
MAPSRLRGSVMAGVMDLGGGPWLTPDQLAVKLGISLDTLSAWRALGDGPPWFLVGSELRYNEADFSRRLGGITGERA